MGGWGEKGPPINDRSYVTRWDVDAHQDTTVSFLPFEDIRNRIFH